MGQDKQLVAFLAARGLRGWRKNVSDPEDDTLDGR